MSATKGAAMSEMAIPGEASGVGRRAAAIPWRAWFGLLALCAVLFAPGQAAVPPVDRDEARFAQASRQMLESGDFVDIRFQDDPRHNKPAGIYWLQAASVALFSDPGSSAIWPYRLPSALGATAAVLLTAWAGVRLFGPAAALAGAALLAGTVLLAIEARLAKTDAVLLATIVWAQGALARAYLGRRETGAVPIGLPVALGFWIALGLGGLVKGPIPLMVAALTAMALVIVDRRADWLRDLRPAVGVPLALLVAAPWFVAIGLQSGGGFYEDSVGTDLLGKLFSGQESHGAPPGYYLGLFFVTFWPATLGVVLAVPMVRRRLAEPAVRFCLAWIVPTWVVFELVATKLPHYVMPTYPALALLAAWAVFERPRDVAAGPPGRAGRIAAALLYGIPAFGLPLALAALPVVSEGRPFWLAVAVVPVAWALAYAGYRFAMRGERRAWAVGAPVAAMALLTAVAFQAVAPALDTAHVSRAVARAVADVAPCPPARTRVAAAHFTEPSLVFLLGTDTVIAGDAAPAVETLAADACAVAVIRETRIDAFEAGMAERGLAAEPVGEVSGFNYSKGDRLRLTLYRRADAPPEPSEPGE